MWEVFASVGFIWGDFNIFFVTYFSLYSSPLQVMVFILMFFSGPSEAHLGIICSVFNQMEEEIGRKRCVLWSFEAWSCDDDAGKDTVGQRWRKRVQKAVQLQCTDPETVDTDGTTCMGHMHLFSIALNLSNYAFPMLCASPSIAASLAHCYIPSS